MQLAVVDTLPIGGVEVVIANDIAEGEVINNPVIESMTGNESPMEFVDDRAESPICVVTRARAKAIDLSDVDLDIGTDTVFNKNDEVSPEIKAQAGWERDSLKVEQEKEFGEKECISMEPTELSKPIVRWYQGILYRFSRAVGAPANSCEIKRQIMVPESYRTRLMWLAHEDHLAGHFGVSKTMKSLAEHFFWPKMKSYVKRLCRFL